MYLGQVLFHPLATHSKRHCLVTPAPLCRFASQSIRFMSQVNSYSVHLTSVEFQYRGEIAVFDLDSAESNITVAFSIIATIYYTVDVWRKEQDGEDGVWALKDQFPVDFLQNVAHYFLIYTMEARISRNTRLAKKKGSCRISIGRRAWLLRNTSSPHWNSSRTLLHAVQPPRNHGQKPSWTMYCIIQ